ncbi:hypothetical protein ACFU8I_33595 [Streptomyces sp. NPDC057540]|uniref:hypothetical protein n=1 Tax=Streptomyces sp. NPDC057540 TaxID=3346160 RepID=UPI00369F6F8C
MPDPVVLAGQTIKADAINSLVAPHVQAYNPSFSIPSGAGTYTACAYTSALSSNTPTMWTIGQPTRLIAPSPGVYLLHGGLIWTSALSTFDGRGEIRANGGASPTSGTRVGTQRGSSGNMQSTISGTVTLTAGQYIELYLNTQAGVAVAVAATLGMTRISLT